jgi:hypothetical protein
MYLTLDAMAIAIMVHEWRKAGRLSPYTLVGAGWLLLQQLLHYPATHSEWFAAAVYELMGMVRYR